MLGEYSPPFIEPPVLEIPFDQTRINLPSYTSDVDGSDGVLQLCHLGDIM